MATIPSPASSPSFRRIALDGSWQFQVEGDDQIRTIQVPGPWESQFPELEGRSVIATYTRTIRVPRSFANGIVRLHVGAADYFSEVEVNGYPVGTHEGGYLPFNLEIQEFLRFGEDNTLTIRVQDGAPGQAVTGAGDLTPAATLTPGEKPPARPFPFTEIPHGKQSWYATVGGIWGSCWLEQRHDTFVDNVFVRPDVARQGASVRIRLAHPPLAAGDYSLRLIVAPPAGAPAVSPVEVPVPGARQTTLNVVLPLPDPLLWEPDAPHLYGLRVELVAINAKAARVMDAFETRFGMRTIEAADGRILLNGHPIFLAGALDQDFYPGTIYTPPSTAYLRDQFQKAKQMGLNLLRCHIKTPDPRYLDLCDEMGLLVWYEIPNWAILTKKSGRRGREHLEAMLERDYNHASLLILSVMNESWGIDLSEKWQREWLVEMFDYAKQVDPTRIVVDNSACDGNFHVKSDLDDYHVYYSIPDHARTWARWCADFASRPAWTYSHYGDAQRTKKEPIVLSEFGNWGLPKLSALRKGYGGRDPWWFQTGAGSARPEGCEERYHQYGLDRVFGGGWDKMAARSQEQEWVGLKYEIETMRKHSGIVGYVITEFTDLHWEANGLLDMCRNPKTFHKRLPNLQGQDLLICDHQTRTAFWGGENVLLPVLLSHFSRRDLAGATLAWDVDGANDLHGELALGDAPPPIGTSAAGSVSFRVPDGRAAREVTLTMRLLDRAGELVTENTEMLAFFPAQARDITLKQAVYVYDPLDSFPAAAKVLRGAGVRLSDRLEPGVTCLTSILDEKVLRFVQHGGAALLLALEREALPRTASGLASLDRDKNGWWGDWCSGLNWFRPDGARKNGPFASLPQTRQFNFTYEPITPRRVLAGWDAEKDANDIWAGLFLGWVRFPAALCAGLKHGDGKILATTFDLFKDAPRVPTGLVLLGDLLRFVSSSAFRPQKTADLARLELSQTLLATAEEKGTTWRYLTTDPGPDWTRPDFPDQAWKSGKSGFGRGLDQVTARTRWNSADIYLRTRVTVPPEGIGRATLRFFHDDDLEIYVNGEPLLAREKYVSDYEDVPLAPDQIALFTPGQNILCVHCRNSHGAQFVDVGITYEPVQALGGALRAPGEGSASANGTTVGGNPGATSAQVAERQEETLQTTGS